MLEILFIAIALGLFLYGSSLIRASRRKGNQNYSTSPSGAGIDIEHGIVITNDDGVVRPQSKLSAHALNSSL